MARGMKTAPGRWITTKDAYGMWASGKVGLNMHGIIICTAGSLENHNTFTEAIQHATKQAALEKHHTATGFHPQGILKAAREDKWPPSS